MKSLNNVVLEKRKEAMAFSKAISQNNGIFNAPLEVKKRRGKLGSACGSITLLIAIVLYIINLPSIAIGLSVVGVLTLALNLVMLNYLDK